MKNDLKTRLENHKMWLLDDSKGKRFVARKGENFYSASLSYANLSYADLHYANLSAADLSYANLRYANLSAASLSYANLSYADLHYANLSAADLSYASLSYVEGFKFTPLQIVNTRYFITIFDDHVVWGCKKITFDELESFKLLSFNDGWSEDDFNSDKELITETIRRYRKQLI